MSNTLYGDIILDHYHHPRHYGTIKKPTHRADADNPSCGDQLHMEAVIRKNKIVDLAFTGTGCAISQAAASLLSEQLVGKSVLTLKRFTSPKMLALLGLPLTPNRIKCGLLALETAQKLIV